MTSQRKPAATVDLSSDAGVRKASRWRSQAARLSTAVPSTATTDDSTTTDARVEFQGALAIAITEGRLPPLFNSPRATAALARIIDAHPFATPEQIAAAYDAFDVDQYVATHPAPVRVVPPWARAQRNPISRQANWRPPTSSRQPPGGV